MSRSSDEIKAHRGIVPETNLRKISDDLKIDDCALPWWDGGHRCMTPKKHHFSYTNLTRGYCSFSAHKLGPGQKVISYCLYGNFSEYATGLDDLLKTVIHIYPGWVVRLYTQPHLYKKELLPLLKRHSHLYICDAFNLPGEIQYLTGVDPRLWRAAVLGDELVDVFLARDLDSTILEREADAVKEFLTSGHWLHIMKDHPAHGVPILAGTFGVVQTSANLQLLNTIRQQLFRKKLFLPTDQSLLANFLYPQLRQNSLIHDSYTCAHFPGSVPFPTQRQDGQFVGNRRYREKYRNETLRKKCPINCRPRAHPGWEFC
ncbi:hypothetical protein FHG87_000342 [Trinorchestia longiramus]|nr:hypothetical protein FHG87_000342 [Trinorchestia longiramus]